MAVREIKNLNDLKANVVMKDGREFLGCDITPQGAADRVVSFWNDGAIRMVPLQDVLHVDYYEDSSP